MLQLFAGQKSFISILENLRRGAQRQFAEGLWGSSASLFAAALFKESGRSVIFVKQDSQAAETACEELKNFLSPEDLRIFPPSENGAPGRSAQRLRTVAGFASGLPVFAAAPVQALLQPLLKSEDVGGEFFEVRPGGSLTPGVMTARLSAAGYARASAVHFPGEFALRGGILDVFPVQDELPSRIEFDGSAVLSIRRFNTETQLSAGMAGSVRLLPLVKDGAAGRAFFAVLPRDSIIVVSDPPRVFAKAAESESFALELSRDALPARRVSAAALSERFEAFCRVDVFPFEAPEGDEFPRAGFAVSALDRAAAGERAMSAVLSSAASGSRVFVFCDNDAVFRRVRELRREAPGPGRRITPVRGFLASGFAVPGLSLALFSSGRGLPAAASRGLPALDRSELSEGDYVVHINHGVGVYRGLKMLEAGGREGEFLGIEYLDGDMLYAPPSQVHLISKYAGVEGHAPVLSRLGGSAWKRARAKAERSIRDLAGELLELGASRAFGEGFGFSEDGDWQRGLEDSFVYEETDGQLKAIGEVKKDMESARAMDRIVCGDSGYGKTEVAVRAAFKCAMDGKQTAVLVPTTVLAEQHYSTFAGRMEGYPVNIGVLSRFRSPSGQRRTVEGLKSGAVDIVIGTHRLLQRDVSFKDLGLVIIDEEQRFGVSQKEKLKKIRSLVDVLSMSATPIPRTLYMSLAGIRDISIIETAPGMRLPVEGRVAPFSRRLVRLAVLRELERNCQAFYLHNRVDTIENAARMLSETVPEARIGIAHGQMAPGELDEAMKRFLDYKVDVLVCTTIIEAGLDIQRANTIIIERADTFGLADLYQLKGRVGRWNRKGYAFFLMPSGGLRTPESEKRLKAVEDIAGPGGGFNTAMKDLELRGAGNLLGRQQHGHIAAVGFDLYCRLLRRTAAEMKGEPEPDNEAVFDLGFEHFIPEWYIRDIAERVNFYRRFSSARTIGDIDSLESELRDRFGKAPPEVRRMLKAAVLRVRAGEKGIAYAGVVNGVLKLKFLDGRSVEETLDSGSGSGGILEMLEEKIGAYKS